jgi:hypothetical protein
MPATPLPYRVSYRGGVSPLAAPAIVWLCRLRGCGAEREPGVLMCAAHWAQVPPELRAGYADAVAALADVARLCLQAVGSPA